VPVISVVVFVILTALIALTGVLITASALTRQRAGSARLRASLAAGEAGTAAEAEGASSGDRGGTERTDPLKGVRTDPLLSERADPLPSERTDPLTAPTSSAPGEDRDSPETSDKER